MRVEFEVTSDCRFRDLFAAFEAIRTAKESDDWRDDDYWLTFFDDESRRHFWWPSPSELQDWERRWFETPVSERFSNPTLATPWTFGSMIDALRHGDYKLIACLRSGTKMAVLSFEPYAWPFGGTGGMRKLIEAFGHRVVSEPSQ